MPETDIPKTNVPNPPAPSEGAQTRADSLRRLAGTPHAQGSGLLPDALAELNATVEELRVAEEEMRAQNEELLLTRLRVEAERHRYQDLFEFAPDGYLVTDLGGKIREANRAASELLGIAPRFLKGRALATSVAPDDLPAYSAALTALTASAPQHQTQERALRLRRRHAGLFHAAVTVAPVPALGDQPATLRWLVRDISARREAEAARLALSERERHIADTLQRLLLPAVPVGGFDRLSVETFFQAASDEAEGGGSEIGGIEIGGGFFDAFALGAGVVALAAGVVSGGGLAAATRSAEIRYALRVLLRETRRPASALARLNDAVCEALSLGDAGGDRPVALTLATLDTRTGEAALSAAGGEPPLFVRAGRAAETFGDCGPTLGVQPGVSYGETQATLGAGDTLLLLTAGLTAAGSVAEIAAAHHADMLPVMAQAVLGGVRAGSGGTLRGDVCLQLARRQE